MIVGSVDRRRRAAKSANHAKQTSCAQKARRSFKALFGLPDAAFPKDFLPTFFGS